MGKKKARSIVPPPLRAELRNDPTMQLTIPEMIETYVTRRLKTLCRLTGVTDMTTAVATNLEAKFKAIEHIIDEAGI
eukprot:9793603-Lingulodinium_polyedra.AAC.1